MENAVDTGNLATRLKNDEEAAFGDFVRTHWDKAFSRAYGLLKNREDAEEVAQDAFIRARNGMENFRGECSPSTWLHRIVTNLARNKYWYWFRRRRGESFSIDSQISEDSETTFAETLACETLNPSEMALANEFEEILPRAMASLDEKYAVVLRMRSEMDMSYEEIAAKLNLTVGTVKSRLSRAREQLRDILSDNI